MTDLTCTWLILAKKNKADEVVPEHLCGQKATATYSRRNPKRRQPDQPEQIIHPRCSTHDTPAAQRAAPEQGYVRESL